MSGAYVYPMTLASLPRHGDLFSAKRPPISRIGLERRLRLLPDADQAEIDAIEGVLSWSRAQAFASDAQALLHLDAVMGALRGRFVRELVAARISMRTIMAALRRRAAGGDPPKRGEDFGRTPYADRIRRRWSAPGFGLGPGEAWALRADLALRAGDSLLVEREILGEAWRRLGRVRPADPHGYEALVVYVLRWNLIDRWTRYAQGPALARFSAWTAEPAP